MNVTTHRTCGLVPAPRPSLISPQLPALSPDPGLAPYLSRAQAKGPGQGPRPKAELRKCRGTHGDDCLCATALGAPSDSPARRSRHGHCQGDFPTGQTTCVGFLGRLMGSSRVTSEDTQLAALAPEHPSMPHLPAR